MESVKLPSVVFFGHIRDCDIQDGVPFLYCVQEPLCFRIYIGLAAIWEGNEESGNCTVTYK